MYKKTQSFAPITKHEADVFDPIIGHHAPDGDAFAGKLKNGPDQKLGACLSALIRQDLDVGRTTEIIDADMNEVIANIRTFLASIT